MTALPATPLSVYLIDEIGEKSWVIATSPEHAVAILAENLAEDIEDLSIVGVERLDDDSVFSLVSEGGRLELRLQKTCKQWIEFIGVPGCLAATYW